MSTTPSNEHDPERIALFALLALPAAEMFAMEAHIAVCAECRQQVERLRPVVDSFVSWPTAIVRPTTSLWDRIAGGLEQEPGETTRIGFVDDWREPEWTEASPGLSYQLLSKDSDTDRVTMLVRLEPGAEYPAHVHAGLEELHLLDGELWIDDQKLQPGDYNRAEKDTADQRVWSETGCTCVLITSHRDILK